jgi:hypothetical protein
LKKLEGCTPLQRFIKKAEAKVKVTKRKKQVKNRMGKKRRPD